MNDRLEARQEVLKINWGRLLVPVMAVLLAAGCAGGGGGSPQQPDENVDLATADVVGVWQNGKDGAVLQFAEDGTFTASNLPYQKFVNFPGVLPEGFDGKRDRLPGSGKWSTDTPLGYPKGPRSVVNLSVRVLAGRPTSGRIPIEAEARDGQTVLVFYLGDPDLNNRIVYQRCREGCPTLTPSNI